MATSYQSQMSDIFSQLADIFWHLIDPIVFLVLAASYLPETVVGLLAEMDVRSLVSPWKFKQAWFARFWRFQGPLTRETAMPRVGPLVERAEGVVLEIGAGTGEWVRCYDKGKVKKIYGVEPNRDHHASLTKRIEEAGLEDVYEIVPVGVENLTQYFEGKQGKVDCIVTVQCLCSVNNPERMIRELYSWLEEGGKWIVYEHVVIFGWQGWEMKWYQSLINIVWPHFLGGCEITRDSGKWLKEVGPWTKVDLRQPEDEIKYQVLPHIMGVLTK